MDWIKVVSSQIEEVGYEPEAEFPLGVKFPPNRKQKAEQQPGAIYEYANVTPELFESLLRAESVGSFFNQNIKLRADLYPYRRAV